MNNTDKVYPQVDDVPDNVKIRKVVHIFIALIT